jgi:hypothetical protein
MSVNPQLDRLGRGGMVQQNGDCVCVWVGPWLGRPQGHRLAEWILCGRMRPREHGPAVRRSCVFVSPTWQALGAGRAEQRSCRAAQAWGGRGLVEIANVCGSLALRADSTEIMQF